MHTTCLTKVPSGLFCLKVPISRLLLNCLDSMKVGFNLFLFIISLADFTRQKLLKIFKRILAACYISSIDLIRFIYSLNLSQNCWLLLLNDSLFGSLLVSRTIEYWVCYYVLVEIKTILNVLLLLAVWTLKLNRISANAAVP